MLTNITSKREFYRAPIDPVGGAVADPDPEVDPAAADPLQDPAPAPTTFTEEEVSRRVAEATSQWKVDYLTDQQKRQQVPPPAPTADPSVALRERMKQIAEIPEYEDQLAAIYNMAKSDSMAEAVDTLRKEFAPALQHSAIQSATSVIVNHFPDLASDARPYVEGVVREYGFTPQQLENPKNAKLVAEAAQWQAYKAGGTSSAAPAATPRTPVAAAAPTHTPVTPTDLPGMTREEQQHLNKYMADYTPYGFKSEDYFTTREKKAILQEFREAKNARENAF